MGQHGAAKNEFRQAVAARHDQLVALCRDLVRIDSQNPPGDTHTITEFVANWLGGREGIAVDRVIGREPIVNLVVRMPCGTGGRRLVFNAHLDTFPIGAFEDWSVPPLDGLLCDGRIYGRGVSDMKAGLAATLMSLDVLAQFRVHLAGELVLTLVGDEETGGIWGTKHLLENVPEAAGDAVLNADAGSPRVVRFGEKGQMWVALEATGRGAHGAHVHLGANAIDRLIEAIARVRRLETYACKLPPEIDQAISAAASVSEAVSGSGESALLKRISVNVGTIEGGTSVNMVAERAKARLDIRFPPGLDPDEVNTMIRTELADLEFIKLEIISSCAPCWSDPNSEIVQLAIENSRLVLGSEAVPNMRLGFSDARYFRQKAIPAIVYGPTPYNMGGPDEYVTLDDLWAVFQVHALTAFDYMSKR